LICNDILSTFQNPNTTFKRIMLLQTMPDDILFSIVEFINPRCSQERIHILCEVVIPHLPYLVKYFKKRLDDCELEDHFYVQDKSFCIHKIPKLSDDTELHRYYFHTILKNIANDNRMKVRKKSLETAYTYHFPDEIMFEKNHPVVEFIVSEILSKTHYKFSHMCCSGKGIFASVLS